MTTSPIDLNAQLRQLGFSLEDLAANRSGSLTERQRDEIANRQTIYVRNGRFMLLVMWLGFATVIVGFQLVPLLLGSKSLDSFNAELPYIGLSLLILSGLMGVALVWSIIGARNLMSGTIRVAEGQAKVRIRTLPGRYKHYPRCEVKLGGRTFLLVDRNQFDAFVDGVGYRVFYIPFAPLHVILSAEVI